MNTKPTYVPPAPRPVATVRRRRVFGVPMAMTDYDGAMDVMDSMIEARERGWICASSVHSLIVAQDDPDMHTALTEFVMTVPDGMPIVWAANMLGENLTDRVYGPELMSRYCARAADKGHRVWLYGGRDEEALADLMLNLRRRYPGLQIVGAHSPPFRPLTEAEDEEVLRSIERARPDVIWVGIGVPKQEKWMVRMRERIEAPVMCAVGAAFDFHAGRVSQAPEWMQTRGLEWVYRLTQEPRRLFPRYLETNPRFILGFARQYLAERRAART